MSNAFVSGNAQIQYVANLLQITQKEILSKNITNLKIY